MYHKHSLVEPTWNFVWWINAYWEFFGKTLEIQGSCIGDSYKIFQQHAKSYKNFYATFEIYKTFIFKILETCLEISKPHVLL